MQFRDFTQLGNNWTSTLYVGSDGKHYRLEARGITPNRCWLIAPTMRELVDIDISTGHDVYGPEVHRLDTGTVPHCYNFIRPQPQE